MRFRFPRPSLSTGIKACSGFLVAMFVFGVPLADAVPSLNTVSIAQAQGGYIPGGIAGRPKPIPCGAPGGIGIMCTDYGQYQLTIGKIENAIDHTLMMAAFTSAWNAAQYFTQTIAYDTAEWVANGFRGQKPGIFTDQWDVYLQRLSLDAAGEFMGSFSEDFTKGALGLDLCAPPNFPELALEFQLSIPGLLNEIKRPAPKCSWTTITQNWEQAAQSLDNVESIQNIRSSFSQGGNDISFGVGAHLAFFDAVAAHREAGLQERLEGQGYKSVNDFISGTIETPASAVKKAAEYQLIEAPYVDQTTRFNALLSASFDVGIVQLGVLTASTFTNVLLSRLLGKLASGLFKSSGTAALPNLFDPNAAAPGSTDPEQIFASQFADLKVPHIVKPEEVDILSELIACPAEARTKWNCALDDYLATAIRQGGGLTVRQAIDQGFISPEWQLIPSAQARDNQDPSCRTRAFCAGNLSKLRLARVLPIGWELAAESQANQQRCISFGGCVTLGEVISNFQNCNDEGQLDAEHPWCHLVDPNWVLTIPPAQCEVQGYGNQIIRGTNQRLAECQDVSTCLRRDKDGRCVDGYGYCMAEQTFWQFEAPACEAQFASCRTYTARNGGRPVSYLRSTIDYGFCDASNVGCMWYALYRDPSTAGVQGADTWNATTTASTIPDGSAMDRIYLDASVEPCDASGDGCTALLRTEPGRAALNLVPNGSFETVADDGTLVGWTGVNGTFSPANPGDGTAASHGAQSLVASGAAISGSLETTQPVAVRPLRQYVLSFYARQYVNSVNGGAVYVEQQDATGTPITDDGTDYFAGADCSYVSGADARGTSATNVTANWRRFTCTFVTAAATRQARVVVLPASNENSAPLIDGIQLEEGDVAAPFVDGINTSLAQVNMKVPPEELACQGEPATDHPLCSNYAPVCRQSESGCQGYRPVDGGITSDIPAVLTAADRCPAECVGYAEYRKQGSTFDLVRSTDERLDDPEDDTAAFFVPKTALACSAQDVGCEVFTNLSDTGASTQAYRALRACELPGSDTQTYYTWEGSDTSGYQLKTWSLKRDTTVPVPQPPRVVARVGTNGVYKDPSTCNADTYTAAADPDCRQFYDPQGNVFYRFESQTVLSATSCVQLRKEGSTRADCEKTGGSFNAATNQCVYSADPGSSTQCAATYAGCRAYVGTQGRAQEEIFYEEFLDDNYRARTSGAEGGAAQSAIALSDEAILVGDKSLRIQPVGNNQATFFGPMPLQPGALYEVSFWAKATAPTGARAVLRDTSGQPVSPAATVDIGPEWRTYRIGPIAFPSDVMTQGMVQLSVEGTPLFFVDKFRVERVRDVAYVVKDSWKTPASCDRTPEGVPQPQAMLGCREYTDREGQTVTLRQFTRLCRETAIGCSAFVNTQNTQTSSRQTWERPAAQTDADAEVTASFEDRYDYYIDNESYYCREEQLGCRAFGRPNYTQDRLGLKGDAPFTTVYLKVNPAAYDEAICSERELFCDAFAYSNDKGAGTSYFRAPADHACEYRTATSVNPPESVPNFDTTGRTYDGWFRVGTDIPCDPDFLQNGGLFGIRFTGDESYNAWAGAAATYENGSTYQGWTGTCPQAAAECTELRDVNDTSDPQNPAGRPYYVVNNSQLDTTSCNGRVNPGDGCVLFRDVTSPNLMYNAAATYRAYQARRYQAVDPVDCSISPTPEFCEGANENDTNLVIRVKPDRACSAWLACSTAETVFDPQDGTYKSICTDLALCSQVGAPEGNSVPFCANYIDRADATETLLQEYKVFSAAHYASRPTQFGAPDYSGLTMPDQFQVMDTELLPVGNLFSLDAQARSRLAKDYRLVVGVPIVNERPTEQPIWRYGAAPASLVGGAAVSAIASSNLAPYACVFRAPGTPAFIPPTEPGLTYGIMTDNLNNLSTNGTTCWLAVDQTQPVRVTEFFDGPTATENTNMLLLIQKLEDALPGEVAQSIERALPGALCKAAPEADAPFDGRFVLEWDGSVTPPTPSRVREGYRSVNFCEYGEDCSCTYKRVSYGSVHKFYEPLSTDVVNAVCVGGPRAGLPCVVDAGIQGSVTPDVRTIASEGEEGRQIDVNAFLRGEGAGATTGSTCGTGGVCQAIQSVSLVRGAVGQCLEYDMTRPLPGSQSEFECLAWNPNPVFLGPSDVYHWMPTAGFQPPQSSGRYYCISPYRQPRSIEFKPDTLNVQAYLSGGTQNLVDDHIGFMKNDAGTWAGQIKEFHYRDATASDGSCDPGTAVSILTGGVSDVIADIAGCDGNQGGASLDGARASGTTMGQWCELVDDEGLGRAVDTRAVRLVTTGKGRGRSYAEYAIMADWQQIGRNIAGYAPTVDATAVDLEVVKAHALEDAISGFTFSTPGQKLGCAYSPDWVQGVNVADYDDEEIVRQQDAVWLAGFRQELAKNGGKLDRRNAQIVTDEGTANGTPTRVECSDSDSSPNGLCYLKTWTLDYRAEGQRKFQAFSPSISRQSMQSLSRAPVYGKCEASQSWFSIRAVFENTNRSENSKDPDQIRPDSMVGPFRFVGFWVTACSPQDGPRYIYMSVSLDTADICRELAETISKDSADNAAFTDRNWAFGTYQIPKLGYQWETTNVPFGASLSTRTADEEPLYMSGVRQAESNVLHPPTFTFSGQTYFRGDNYPRSNWGILSNVFARIYRIYAYNTRGVSSADWACTDPRSPNFGQWCPDLAASGLETAEQRALSRNFCGFESECVSVGFSAETAFGEKVCNSLSGVNRGLDCSLDPDICHAGPATIRQDGVLTAQYAACEVYQGWEQLDENGSFWRCTGGGCPSECTGQAGCGRGTATQQGAFRCAANSALSPDRTTGSVNLSYCTNPMATSPECPLYVSTLCVDEEGNRKGNNGEIGTCEGYPWAQCLTNADCTFEAKNYWPAGSTANNRVNMAEGIKYAPQFSVDLGQNITNAQPRSVYFIEDTEGWPPLNNGCEGDEPGTCLIREAFDPVKPASVPSLNQEATLFFTRRLQDDPRGVESARLYPGFVPLIADFGDVLDLPGCDGNPNNCNYRWWPLIEDEHIETFPFIYYGTLWSGEVDDGQCVGTQTSTRGGGTTVTYACEGGAKDGETCRSDAECVVDTPICRWESEQVRNTTRSVQKCLGGPRDGQYCTNDAACGASEATISGELAAHYGACEPKALMVYPTQAQPNRMGTCRGGVRAGALCYEKDDCLPSIPKATRDRLIADSSTWCNPAAGSVTQQNYACWGFISYPDAATQNATLTATNAPGRLGIDASNDNNICTRPPGYWPRANVCKDPNDEYCGLFWYDLRNRAQSVNDSAHLPTDVTPGLYSPSYPELGGGANVSTNNADYSYLDYYNPIPPTIASLDAGSCQGGTCKVGELGAFTIDAVNGGVVNGGAGSHIASLRFYAWAAHEQMPLRRLAIDWGDGQVTELPDAFLKNHKPYCGAQKECVTNPSDPNSATGLTCQTDNDCPAGLGAVCMARGSCASGPRAGQACITDASCDSSTGNDGVCQPRVYFGNDQGACEEQFFEFRHVYTCTTDTQPNPQCETGGHCSGNQNRACSTATDCAPGDSCLQNLAPRDGCRDNDLRACRFTPRIIAIDNWGWSTGECRAARNDQGLPVDASNARILHPNGGCYDASRLRSNVAPQPLLDPNWNETDATSASNPAGAWRPWVVFPGSIQVQRASE